MPFLFSYTCPHCRAFVGEQNVFEHWDKNDPGNAKDYLVVFICRQCHRAIVAHFTARDEQRLDTNLHYKVGVDVKPTKVYPQPEVINIDKENIPERIYKIYYQALKASQDGVLIDPACSTFRKTIEAILCDVIKEEETHNLKNAIEKALEQQLIAPQMKEWADEVRLAGNLAAHLKPDELTPEDVVDIKLFTELLIEYIYVIPARIKARQETREKQD